jgi:putative Mn2+ efflux pump MntP
MFYFPFWNKIIHLEKVMDKITYKRHYLGGLIPMVLILGLGFTNLSTLILILLFFITSFIPYLLFFIFLRNRGTNIKKTLKIIGGALFIGFGYIFRPEIIDNYTGISENLDFLINLTYFTAPILFILGTLFIFNSFRKELKYPN